MTHQSEYYEQANCEKTSRNTMWLTLGFRTVEKEDQHQDGQVSFDILHLMATDVHSLPVSARHVPLSEFYVRIRFMRM